MDTNESNLDPALQQRLDSLKHSFSRIKGMITLPNSKIKTYKDVLLELGLTEWEGIDMSECVTLGEKLDSFFSAVEFYIQFTWKQPEEHPPTVEVTIPKDVEISRALLARYKPSDKQSAVLMEFQRKYSQAAYELLEHKHAIALNAATGTGKTFILGQLLRWLLDNKYAEKVQSLSPMPYVYVTKASVVEQTKRVLETQFGIDCTTEVLVTNYDQLRSSFGEWFVEEKLHIEFGQEYTLWKWKPYLHPCVLILDEYQAVKNLDSTQSKIFQAFNDIQDENIRLICASATLFTRVCESKVFAVATRHNISMALGNVPLSNNNFSDWAKRIASPAEPEEYSPSACNRLVKELAPYIVTVKGVRSKFHAKNSTRLIEFENDRDRTYYANAFERYLEEKAKLESSSDLSNSKFLLLVASMKFRQAAEIIRAPFMAREMWENVNKHGKASIAACCFQHTIAKVANILYSDYAVPRDKISLIWGGSAAFRSSSERYTPEYIRQVYTDLAFGRGDDYPKKVIKEITQQIMSQSMGLGEIPEGLRLGPQSRSARQEEIDRFQSGNSLYCLFTFKAGGIGLSLHHTDDMCEFKCRKTPAGWPLDEDIPKVPTRPRRTWVSPVWSALEMVQGLGRAPRLTSLSDTIQELIFYKGTEEERVAWVVSHKLKCLREVVQQKEKWTDVILGDKGKAIWEEEEEAAEDEENSPTSNIDLFDDSSDETEQ